MAAVLHTLLHRSLSLVSFNQTSKPPCTPTITRHAVLWCVYHVLSGQDVDTETFLQSCIGDNFWLVHQSLQAVRAAMVQHPELGAEVEQLLPRLNYSDNTRIVGHKKVPVEPIQVAAHVSVTDYPELDEQINGTFSLVWVWDPVRVCRLPQQHPLRQAQQCQHITVGTSRTRKRKLPSTVFETVSFPEAKVSILAMNCLTLMVSLGMWPSVQVARKARLESVLSAMHLDQLLGPLYHHELRCGVSDPLQWMQQQASKQPPTLSDMGVDLASQCCSFLDTESLHMLAKTNSPFVNDVLTRPCSWESAENDYCHCCDRENHHPYGIVKLYSSLTNLHNVRRAFVEEGYFYGLLKRLCIQSKKLTHLTVWFVTDTDVSNVQMHPECRLESLSIHISSSNTTQATQLLERVAGSKESLKFLRAPIFGSQVPVFPNMRTLHVYPKGLQPGWHQLQNLFCMGSVGVEYIPESVQRLQVWLPPARLPPSVRIISILATRVVGLNELASLISNHPVLQAVYLDYSGNQERYIQGLIKVLNDKSKHRVVLIVKQVHVEEEISNQLLQTCGVVLTDLIGARGHLSTEDVQFLGECTRP